MLIGKTYKAICHTATIIDKVLQIGFCSSVTQKRGEELQRVLAIGHLHDFFGPSTFKLVEVVVAIHGSGCLLADAHIRRDRSVSVSRSKTAAKNMAFVVELLTDSDLESGLKGLDVDVFLTHSYFFYDAKDVATSTRVMPRRSREDAVSLARTL